MSWNMMPLSRIDMPVSLAEGLKILERDQFCCRYCGLDGRSSFDNALMMSVDFVVPRARSGKKKALTQSRGRAPSFVEKKCLDWMAELAASADRVSRQ